MARWWGGPGGAAPCCTHAVGVRSASRSNRRWDIVGGSVAIIRAVSAILWSGSLATPGATSPIGLTARRPPATLAWTATAGSRTAGTGAASAATGPSTPRTGGSRRARNPGQA